MRASFVPGFFSRQSRLSREEKVRLFFSLLAPRPESTLLDVGGGTGKGFQQIWAFFSKVIVLDIDEEALKTAAINNPRIVTLHADACDIPLPDGSVDYVFSNAVIEHIPRSRRGLFAKEIRLVARRGYFVTTPNYWFPYEPHYLMPLWQYLPWGLRRRISQYLALGHIPRGSSVRIDLLTPSELRRYFPEARIGGVKVSCTSPLPATLYAAWAAR